jgi:hypothetical protein
MAEREAAEEKPGGRNIGRSMLSPYKDAYRSIKETLGKKIRKMKVPKSGVW